MIPTPTVPGRAQVSQERLDVIEADILMLTFNTPEAREQLEAEPLFQSLRAVQEGRYVALDLPKALALGFPSAEHRVRRPGGAAADRGGSKLSRERTGRIRP